MRRATSLACVLALLAGEGLARDLTRLDLDDASRIGTVIETDRVIKSQGEGAVRITTQGPVTICLGEVTGPQIEDAQLWYRAKVKSDLDGSAYLELWAHVGGGQYFSRGLNDRVSGKSDWKGIGTPFLFQKGQRPEKVRLNVVIDGKGTLWIDDIVLSEAPL